jgi:glycosyltransferase involved in cell wall biosynthesis
MKIGIYIEVLKATEKTGIGRYVEGLIKSLSEIDSKNEYLLYYQSPLFSKAQVLNLTKGSNFKLRPIRFPTVWFDERPRLWWDYYLPFITNKDKLDIFHGPNHFIPKNGTCKKIVTIHDIAYFYMNVHGEGMDRILENWTRKSLEVADKIITVSDATGEDCVKEGAKPSTVRTVYQGFESSYEHLKLSDKKQQQVIASMQLPENCILFLGSLQPRKNLAQLVEAFALIAHQVPHHLVLAGGKGSSYEQLLTLVEQHKLQERVVFTGYIDDQQRAALYQHAELFVYPSKYEGFGLVILEAMSFGVPVITSDNSSLPEAAGDAGILVSAGDIPALANKIIDVLSDSDLQAELTKKGLQHCKRFSWQQSAQEMLTVYQEVQG